MKTKGETDWIKGISMMLGVTVLVILILSFFIPQINTRLDELEKGTTPYHGIFLDCLLDERCSFPYVMRDGRIVGTTYTWLNDLKALIQQGSWQCDEWISVGEEKTFFKKFIFEVMSENQKLGFSEVEELKCYDSGVCNAIFYKEICAYWSWGKGGEE